MRFLSARLAGVKAPKGQATEQFRSSVAAWKQLDPKQRAQYQNDYEKDQVSAQYQIYIYDEFLLIMKVVIYCRIFSQSTKRLLQNGELL